MNHLHHCKFDGPHRGHLLQDLCLQKFHQSSRLHQHHCQRYEQAVGTLPTMNDKEFQLKPCSLNSETATYSPSITSVDQWVGHTRGKVSSNGKVNYTPSYRITNRRICSQGAEVAFFGVIHWSKAENEIVVTVVTAARLAASSIEV